MAHNERLEFLGDSVLQIVSATTCSTPTPTARRGPDPHPVQPGQRGGAVPVRPGDPPGGLPPPGQGGGALRRPGAAQRGLGRLRGPHRRPLPGRRDGGGPEVHLPFITEGKHAEADYKTRLQEIVQQNPEERLSYVVEKETAPTTTSTLWWRSASTRLCGPGRGAQQKGGGTARRAGGPQAAGRPGDA